MLRLLHVRNYALIEEISVEFDRGLNIITGETGAGKSILIDALGLLLGERASAEVIRKGSDKSVVEGVFAVDSTRPVQTYLKSAGLESEGELIVRREISVKSAGRCFINDSPVPLATLKDLGDRLVDLHGQHDHQSLLRAETHIDMLDDFGGHSQLLETYRAGFDELTRLLTRLAELEKQESRLKERRDLYEFQMKEIDALSPKEAEEDVLEADLKLLENAERLFSMTEELSQILYDGEGSVHSGLVRVRKSLEALRDIDNNFSASAEEARSAEIAADEMAKFVRGYNARIEFNPVRLEEIRERLGHLTLLKKKYGGTLSAVIEHRRRIGDEHNLAENFEAEKGRLVAAIDAGRVRASKAARDLSVARRDAGNRMSKGVVAALAELGIPKARFSVSMEMEKVEAEGGGTYLHSNGSTVAATSKGVDDVEFFLSTNVGEDLKPLVKVASGGEVSRIMLALKTALARADRIPLLIFDEIDVGVSGRIGRAVGMGLKKLAGSHQVVAITHLPQIAGLADSHFAVEKKETAQRTTTSLRRLSIEERVREVAKLMSGAEVTESGLKNARELMGLA